jgi:hypothetical protein
VGGGDDEAARREVLAHHIGEDHLAGRVEGGGGFIEKPDWALDREETREREAPPLARGEVAGREPGEALEPHRTESLIGSASSTQKLGPEIQVLRHGQRGFERVEVRQVMRLFGKDHVRPSTLKPDRAFARPQQSGDDPQQRGLARPVRAGQHQGLPGLRRKIDVPEDRQPTARAGKRGSRNQHHATAERTRGNANLRQCSIMMQWAAPETEYGCCGWCSRALKKLL